MCKDAPVSDTFPMWGVPSRKTCVFEAKTVPERLFEVLIHTQK